MPGVIKDAEIVTETPGSSNLESSKTQRRRQNNPSNDPAKQLLDDKISTRKKLEMLNRIAPASTVQQPSLPPLHSGGAASPLPAGRRAYGAMATSTLLSPPSPLPASPHLSIRRRPLRLDRLVRCRQAHRTRSRRRRILVPRASAAPRPPPMSTTAKLASDVFCRCPIAAHGRICPSPESRPFEDEIAIKPRPRAGAIVISSSGADAALDCLNDLKSLSSKENLNFLQMFDQLYILLHVDNKAMADEITEVITRGRVVRELSTKKSATVKINDLDKLNGFLDWSWKDIQKRLKKIKKKLKFIIYVKKDGQLFEAIKDLDLNRVYLLGDAECDTVEGRCTDRCTVLRVGNFAR